MVASPFAPTSAVRGAILGIEAIACVLMLASCRTPGIASRASLTADPDREANPEAVLPWCTTATACIDLARRFGTGEGLPEKSFGAVTALLGKACELGDPRACVGAAALRNHFGGQAESPRVMGLLERACELQIGIVCQAVAEAYREGFGVKQDLARANLLHETACDLGEPSGCVDLSVSYQEGRGVAKDPAQANTFLEKACALHSGAACTTLGMNLVRGEPVSAADWKRANALFEQGCALGDAAGCADLGSSYANGNGVTPDRPRANELQKKSCDLGSGMGCKNLGVAFAFGAGVPQDWARANALYEQGCDLRYGKACNELGLSLQYARGVAKDMVAASALFAKACDLEEPLGCVQLGYLHATADGPSDMVRANSLYTKACRLGLGLGCSNLGFSYEQGATVPQDWRKANELYVTGCKLGSGKACSNLANNLAKGAGTTKDLQRSLELREKACELGQSESCMDLGEQFATGVDVAKDSSRAASFFEKACELGQGDGCKALLSARLAVKDVPGSLDALTMLARRQPETLGTLDSRFLSYLTSDSFAADAKENRFRLLEAFFDAQWRPPVQRHADVAWRDLARMLLERGREDRAAQVAALITDVDVLLSMRVDGRFDALVRRDPGRYDISRALAAQLRGDREAWAGAPRSLEHLQALLRTLQEAGRAEEALALADEALTRAEAPGPPAFDGAAGLNWLRNRRANLLRLLGRSQEAVEELERASKLTEAGAANVSQRLNLAALYCAVDRPRDALAALKSVGEASNYGAMVLSSVKLRAAIALGDSATANRALAFLRAHQGHGRGVFLESLLYADRLDEAARTLIVQLESSDGRSEALISVQDYIPTPMTQRERKLQARWQRILARADVRAAIARVGRVESFDLVH